MALFEDKSFFGLDIGSSGVRLVQLRPSGSKPVLVSYGSASLPPGLFQSDSGADLANVAGIIRQLLKSTKVGANAVASIPGAQVYTAVVKVPKMTEAELAQAIRWQAEQHVPLGLNEVKLDWSVLPSENPDEEEVLIVAAPLTVVGKYAKIFEMTELELVALEINPIAAARAAVPSTDPPSILVDIGALATDVAIIEGGIVRLVRSVQMGGEAMTRAISKALGLEETQAEQFKQKFGLARDKLEGQLFKALSGVLRKIVDEVERARKFYARDHQAELNRVVLTGGSAKLPELPAYLAATLGAEVALGDPWERVSYSSNIAPQLSEIALEYTTAVGLAMRGMT